ncbi:MAG TPA: glycosyltransferase [Planctomycetaceae bacterium]|nr:glycosyltransferase [Planctomycetaceae bacterium]
MLSIIVPVFNEEESLAELRSQISASCTASQIEYEVIFIDDGSSDSSWSIIEKLAGDHPEISGIRFRRNFGKAAALTAGMEAARGEWLMMMDADLQDDPAEIPKFLDKAAEGFDVVNGWKERRLDPWHKVYPSRVFNGMIGKLTGLKLHDHNCGLKLFHSDVAKEIHIYGELHRFIPVLAYSRGFRVAELVVNHRPRQFGHSKYGVIRFLRGFLDLLTVVFLIGYGQRPQHMLGAIGLFFFALGILGFGYLTLIWVLMNIFDAIPITPIGTRPLLAYSTAATILGAQAMSLGLLAELIVANTVHNRVTFSVRERVGENTPIDF